MGTKWYYAENGERVGPATSEEIVKLIGRDESAPVLIWAEGIAGGLDASGAFEWVANAPDNGRRSAPSADAETNAALELDRPTLARRARNELIEYLTIAAYLAVCFGALLLFKATILESEGIGFAHLSLALVKALILGKFVLILEKLKIGNGKKSVGVLVLDILKKALLFTLLLLLLTAVENVIVGYFHGEDARHALKGLGGGTRPEALATALLMFLILIPYFAYRDIAAKLGEETLSKLLYKRQPLRNEA